MAHFLVKTQLFLTSYYVRNKWKFHWIPWLQSVMVTSQLSLEKILNEKKNTNRNYFNQKIGPKGETKMIGVIKVEWQDDAVPQCFSSTQGKESFLTKLTIKKSSVWKKTKLN